MEPLVVQPGEITRKQKVHQYPLATSGHTFNTCPSGELKEYARCIQTFYGQVPPFIDKNALNRQILEGCPAENLLSRRRPNNTTAIERADGLCELYGHCLDPHSCLAYATEFVDLFLYDHLRSGKVIGTLSEKV